MLTLNADKKLAEAARGEIAARGEFTVGERNDRWLPVVMEGTDDAQCRDLHDWLQTLPGVDYVDVASVHFEVTHED